MKQEFEYKVENLPQAIADAFRRSRDSANLDGLDNAIAIDRLNERLNELVFVSMQMNKPVYLIVSPNAISDRDAVVSGMSTDTLEASGGRRLGERIVFQLGQSPIRVYFLAGGVFYTVTEGGEKQTEGCFTPGQVVGLTTESPDQYLASLEI
jgi:hypothetical protein